MKKNNEEQFRKNSKPQRLYIEVKLLKRKTSFRFSSCGPLVFKHPNYLHKQRSQMFPINCLMMMLGVSYCTCRNFDCH